MTVSLMDLEEDFERWKLRYDNPHQVTATQINAYTKSEISKLLDAFVPYDWLPMSIFGDPNQATLPATVKTTTISATVTLGDAMEVALLAGSKALFKQKEWTFSVLSGTTWYIYCTSTSTGSDQIAKLESTRTPRPDTPTNFYVGKFVNSGGRITSTMEAVVMLGTYRLSATPRGSAIPVSTGLPTEKGKYRW